MNKMDNNSDTWTEKYTEEAECYVNYRFMCYYCCTENKDRVLLKESESKEFVFKDSQTKADRNREIMRWRSKVQVDLQNNLDSRIKKLNDLAEKVICQWENINDEDVSDTPAYAMYWYYLQQLEGFMCYKCKKIQPYMRIQSEHIPLSPYKYIAWFSGILSMLLIVAFVGSKMPGVIKLWLFSLLALTGYSIYKCKTWYPRMKNNYLETLRSTPCMPSSLPVFEKDEEQ